MVLCHGLGGRHILVDSRRSFGFDAPRDSADDLRPSPITLGVSKYVNYIIIIVLLDTLTFFSLEAFNLYNWTQWALCTASSAVLTIVLILVIENIRRKR